MYDEPRHEDHTTTFSKRSLDSSFCFDIIYMSQIYQGQQCAPFLIKHLHDEI